ncbi:MAG: hypothetical protein HC877_01710 [Thioploca sp.]|nr:hypothetical protein [Thioploca sp.]
MEIFLAVKPNRRLFFGLASRAEEDCHAIYAEVGKLSIPCVEIPNQENLIYNVEMQQMLADDSIQFKVTQIDTPAKPNEIDFTVIAANSLPYENDGAKLKEQHFEIVRDRNQLSSLRGKLSVNSEKTVEPVVDFAQEMVIALILGVQLADQYRFNVEKVTETNSYIKVTVKIEALPYKSTTTNLVIPYQFIKLKRSYKIITFDFHNIDVPEGTLSSADILFQERKAYDKISPNLRAKMKQSAEHDLISVMLWIVIKQQKVVDKSQATLEEQLAYRQQNQAAQEQLRELFKERLQMEIPQATYSITPTLDVELTSPQILTISRWQEIGLIAFNDTTGFDD